MQGRPPGVDAARRRWWIALLAALLWHLAVFGILQLWAPWETLTTVPRTYEPIDMVFAPLPNEASPTPSAQEPREFTELPEDRADLRPQDPDYLSNVDSRARDRVVDGEDSDLPRLQGESEAPHIGMSPEAEPAPPELPGSGVPDAAGEEGEPRSSEESAAERTREDGGTELLEDLPRIGREGRRGEPGSERRRSGRPRPIPPLEHRVGPAISDLTQEEMRHPMGNVPLFGDVSMNTVAWEWAPWLQRFQRDFYRGWINFVPYAYRIGVIHGRQVVDLEVAPDGTLLSLAVVDREGHESLEEASLANLRSFAPYGPLSEDGSFPEPTLRLRLTIVYPDF